MVVAYKPSALHALAGRGSSMFLSVPDGLSSTPICFRRLQMCYKINIGSVSLDHACIGFIQKRLCTMQGFAVTSRPQQNALLAQALAQMLGSFSSQGADGNHNGADGNESDDSHQGPDENPSPLGNGHGRRRSGRPCAEARGARQTAATNGTSNAGNDSQNSNGRRGSIDGNGSSSGHASAAA